MWREEDAEFRDAWDEISELDTDRIERKALDLAMEGQLDPVMYKGAHVKNEKGEPMHVRRWHPQLMMLLLERRRSSRYSKSKRVEVTSEGGVLVAPASVTPAEWIAAAQARNRECERPGGSDSVSGCWHDAKRRTVRVWQDRYGW